MKKPAYAKGMTGKCKRADSGHAIQHVPEQRHAVKNKVPMRLASQKQPQR